MEWEEKGIRGAGSVVRKAYSFGRHSRQPFGRGLAPLRPLPHLSTLSLREALTAPVTLPLHRLALRTPTGAAPGALLRVCSRRLKHDPDSRLCHRVSVMRPSYHGDGPYIVALRGTPAKQYTHHPWTDTKEDRKSEISSLVSDKSRSHCFDPDNTAC